MKVRDLRLLFTFGVLMIFLMAPAVYAGVESLEVEVLDQQLLIKRYTATGTDQIIWIAPGFGSFDRAQAMSEQLAKQGVEIWHVDLAESLFLANNPATLRAIDARYVAGLIEYAHQLTNKRVTLMARSYGSIPLLAGVRQWQLQNQATHANYLNGAILFSPEMYSTVPALGLDPQYMPITSATNIPIMLYQAGARGNRWQLDKLLARLHEGGAAVYVQIQDGVTGMFYEKDNAPETLAALEAFPKKIGGVLKLLASTPFPSAPVASAQRFVDVGRGLDANLKTFKGNPQPFALDLFDVEQKRYQRTDYRGKITIVNFWASWCSPCVEEIPSLNRLRSLMKNKPFELISINYAESATRVKQFLQEVKVEFPVLLDKDGKISAQWNVLVYPSTFVIGPDGKIHYGANAGLQWDSEEIVEMINRLNH